MVPFNLDFRKLFDLVDHRRTGRGGWGAAASPVGKKKYYSGKTDVPFGQRQ